jgi:hypothetical protein
MTSRRHAAMTLFVAVLSFSATTVVAVAGCSTDGLSSGSKQGDLGDGGAESGDADAPSGAEPAIAAFVTYTASNGDVATFVSHLAGTPYNHEFQSVTISNPGSEARTVVLRGELQGYTKSPAIATIQLAPGQPWTNPFDVALDIAALGAITSPVAANFQLLLASQDGKVLDAKLKNTRILSKNTVFWRGLWGPGPVAAERIHPLVVTSVMTTPHDHWGEIDKLLGEAAPFSSTNAMSGYVGYTSASNTVAQDTAGASDQTAAIYQALKARGVTFGVVDEAFFADRANVLYPAETLRAKAATCVEGAFVFTSALESIGMEPVVYFMPGHVFVGVHVAPAKAANHDTMVFLETTLIGQSDFSAASSRGADEYATQAAAGKLITIPLTEGRGQGYLASPFPL